MKVLKWEFIFTFDKEVFRKDEVEGTTYTQALLNAMSKRPGAEITSLAEVTYG